MRFSNAHKIARGRDARATDNRCFSRVVTVVLMATLFSSVALAQRPRTEPSTASHAQVFELRSDLLSAFWDRDIVLRATVIQPVDRHPTERLPVCYVIHGFGGSHRDAYRTQTLQKMGDSLYGYPRIILVWLNSTFTTGHHIWADSATNGPWGQALTEEFIPAIEKRFEAFGGSAGRFLTGWSSGGHSALWLQVNYPDYFGGVWSGAPDPVDFRDFIGINIYEDGNAYFTENGQPRMLVRRNGRWVQSIKDFTLTTDFGVKQMFSFDAVFSPCGRDGRPLPLFDRDTGQIDSDVAEYWKRYDISLIVRQNWETLGPKLAGKVRIYCGTEDTYRLDGAVRILEQELKELGSDAEIVWVEGRDHSIFRAHSVMWPKGLLEKVNHEMVQQFRDATLGF